MKSKNNSRFIEEFEKYGKLTTSKVIDVHTHMGAIYGARLPVYSIEDCLNLMNDENIENIWCSPHSDLFGVDSVNSEIERIMIKYPDKVKGYFSYNPNYEEYSQQMERALNIDGYIGFKFLPAYHNSSFDSGVYERPLALADENRLVVLCHTWGNTTCNSTKQVENVLRKYKNINLIMGHSAPNECDEAIRLAKEYENAYLDLCDIHRHSGIIEKMVKNAGANKILFGTDLPWYDPNYCIGSVIYADITDDDREKIFFKNAKRILKKRKDCE